MTDLSPLFDADRPLPAPRPKPVPLNTTSAAMVWALRQKLDSADPNAVLRSLESRQPRLVNLDTEDYDPDEGDPAQLHEANVVTSVECIDDGSTPWHLPVLDLDIPVFVLPSSTPGHSHLYIDHPLPWDAYLQLLECLADIGLLEEGYLEASKRRKRTDIRLPWVDKSLAEEAAS